jgi:glycoprotein endo-alpha-1,2-mannosidase
VVQAPVNFFEGKVMDRTAKVLVSCRICLCLVLLTAIAGSVSAADKLWNNNSGDGLWKTAANWSPSLPTLSDKARINSTPGPLINTGTAAVTNWIACGDGGTGALRMTGGTLTVGTSPGDTWTIMGYGSSDNGTFTMDGGVVNTVDRMFVGFQGQGTLNMNGGSLNIGGTFGIGYNTVPVTTARGYVYLYGGTITAPDFQMAYPAGCIGLLDITNGVLIIDGDKASLINGYVSSGIITAFGGVGTVSVDYDVTNPGKTTVMAAINLAKAKAPSPANYAENVSPDANLSWTAGDGALSHNVYFGTANPPASIGNQTGTTFDPPEAMTYNTVYYWRIDEVTGSNTITGDLWTFTTDSGLAKEPDPADGSSYAAIDKVLSWTAGAGATSHNVYLGTNAAAVGAAQRLAGDLDGDGQVDYSDLLILTNYWLIDFDFRDYALLAQDWKMSSSPLFKGNTASTSYDDPCNFEMNTTYYWRIDEVSGSETRGGDVWSFTTTDSNYSLIGKIMCGYQGWFNCPGDGTTRGWVHWGSGSSFAPTACTVDFWPDMTEYDADEKFLASSFYDGTDHYVFSSHNLKTVRRHFQWMQQYGIDGVYLQRFATETTPGSAPFYHRNDVLDYCKDAANLYGRKYAVMYDLSGLNSGGTQKVIDDWKYLVDTKQVGRDPADHGYIFHNGKPVVALWGFGFGRAYEGGDESYNLMNFFKNDPVYGNCTIMLGVNNDWQTSIEMRTLLLVDIISPWAVGRYGYSNSVSWITSHAVAEKAWCDANGKEFLPVIWPGFSWYNMHSGSTPINQHPRYGGQFFWDQLRANIEIAGANMIYVAMFDEVDEGTAIFKVTNNPPTVSPALFVTYRQDLPGEGSGYLPAGDELPSDEYLWLTGQATKALRGEIPLTTTRPARP